MSLAHQADRRSQQAAVCFIRDMHLTAPRTQPDHHNDRMLLRWTTFILWALVAGSAMFWGLRLFVQPQPVPAGTAVATAEGPLRGDLARLLGAEPTTAEAPTAAVADPRFQLLGVLSPRDSRAESEGVALIAVDDRPPRAYRVGMVVDGDTVLQAVHSRGARLGPSGGLTLVALELPPPAPAATGSLPGMPSAGPGNTRPGTAGPAGATGSQGTQIFMPPGQPAPSFTRLRNPSAPPAPAALSLPAPPPELQQPQDTGTATDEATGDADHGENLPNQMPDSDLNLIR